jgi:hypothetical protein
MQERVVCASPHVAEDWVVECLEHVYIRTQIGMFRPIRMDHTNCLQVAIKTLQFNSSSCVTHSPSTVGMFDCGSPTKGMFDCGSPTTTIPIRKQCLKHADAAVRTLFADIGKRTRSSEEDLV